MDLSLMFTLSTRLISYYLTKHEKYDDKPDIH